MPFVCGDADQSEMEDPATPRHDEATYVRRLLILVGIVAVASLLFLTLRWAWHAVLTLLGGVLWGVVIEGSSRFVARYTHMRRWIAMVLLGIVTLALFGLFWWWMGSSIADEFGGIKQKVTEAWSGLQARLGQTTWGSRLLEDAQRAVTSDQVTSRVGGVLSSTVGALGTVLLIFFFGIYFAINPALYVDGGLHLFPKDRRPRLREVLGYVGSAWRSWVLGRTVSMFIVGVGTGIGLWIIDVPMALGLAIIAGVLSFVPNLGPLAAMIPGTLIAFSHGWMTGVWAAVVYVSVQAIESYALTPYIEQRVVSLPPAVLLGFQLLMGVSSGVLGLFLATPLAVAGIVMVQALYIRDVLQDPIPLLGQDERSPKKRRRGAQAETDPKMKRESDVDQTPQRSTPRAAKR